MTPGNGPTDESATPARSISTIVAGIDLSEEALDGLALAALMAERLDANLIVATAVEHLPAATREATYAEASRRYRHEVEARARRQLEHRAFEWRAIQDTASHGLAELAGAEGADLVVIGPTHRGPIGRVLPGSLGESLLHGAPCAVAIAPRGFNEHGSRRLQRVAVAFDDSEEAWEALGFAVAIARASEAHLTLVTVALPLEEGGYWSPQLTVLQEHEDAAKQRVLDLALSNTAGLVIDGRLLHGPPAETIVQASEDYDLLCIGSRGYGPIRRTFPGDVATKVARSARCPVVLTPRSAGADDLWAEELAAGSAPSP